MQLPNRKITADFIYTGVSAPLQNTLIEITVDGTIVGIRKLRPQEKNVEHYQGVICPGFVNTHCHLELSHTKGLISEKKGLVAFIKELQNKRSSTEKELQKSIEKAEQEMLNNGIVAVGDIANGTDSFKQKEKGNLLYHTFIEVFGFLNEKANESFSNGQKLLDLLHQKGLNASIAPHSPYAVSQRLFKKINCNSQEISSIHNQESQAENQLFVEGKGAFLELMHYFGITTHFWKKTNNSSLASVLPYLTNNKRMLLVHNTFSNQEDIEKVVNSNTQFYWCFCPNANIYIENQLPNITLFLNYLDKITLGTDSLASNQYLSILEEMKTLSKHFPLLSLENLIRFGTINGALFLGFDRKIGSIEKGKQPGINLITNIKDGKLSQQSKVEKLADAYK